ncbi:MAG: adenylate/guanylate cyclase domain-containing protein, partial [Leptospiraceae bacterium]|nr:adenylate/guanylate cyclase domain-containing protein [Leptospiraceae bacterium]
KNNQTDYARRSVQSAIDMLTELEVYNNNRVNSGYLPISIGIGIHAGEVMLGTIGSHNRLDTTVIGDAVNIAARLESLCKKYRTRILISKETYDAMVRSTGESQIDSAFDIREIDRLQVSGKNKPVTVMEVFNNDNEALKRQKAATRSAFQSARALFTSRRFTEALHAFQTLSKQAPDDYIYRMYIERCERFLANQPPSADAESMVPA